MSTLVPTGKVDDTRIILRITEGDFAGCEFYYDAVRFGEENPDGSINMIFDYAITNDFVLAESNKIKFGQFVGDELTKLIEEQLDNEAVVYRGGA